MHASKHQCMIVDMMHVIGRGINELLTEDVVRDVGIASPLSRGIHVSGGLLGNEINLFSLRGRDCEGCRRQSPAIHGAKSNGIFRGWLESRGPLDLGALPGAEKWRRANAETISPSTPIPIEGRQKRCTWWRSSGTRAASAFFANLVFGVNSAFTRR